MKLHRIFSITLLTLVGVISVSFIPSYSVFSRLEPLPHPPTLAQSTHSICHTDHRNLASPMFTRIETYKTIIPANSDQTDIYYPKLLHASHCSFPIALLLPGYNVDKSYYSQFSIQVASYGFVVVVPNHLTSIRGKPELFAQVGQVSDVLGFMKTENANPNSPLFGILDPEKLVVIGHSHGGFIGLDAIRGACDPPWCVSEYTRPKELMTGVFFGADLWEDGVYIPINNSGIPIALIAGSRDSLIAPESIQKTYDHIQSPPKAYITILGANHYGITNLNNPPGSPLEKNSPSLDQKLAIETISRWSALFLRAYALDDVRALDYVHRFGNAQETNVTVISQE